MYDILDVRIDSDQTLPEFWMFASSDIRIPSHSDENCVDTAANGGHEDLTDLQSSKARRCVLGEGEQKRHFERYETGW